jgi:hypothetical protein
MRFPEPERFSSQAQLLALYTHKRIPQRHLHCKRPPAMQLNFITQRWPGRSAHGQAREESQPRACPCAERPGHLGFRKTR